jgi:hypothetical protein
MAALDVIIVLLKELSLDAEDLSEGSDAFLEELQSIASLGELIVFCVTINQNLKCTIQKLSLMITVLSQDQIISQILPEQMQQLNGMLQHLHIPAMVQTIKVILEILSGSEDIRSMVNFVLPPETFSPMTVVLDFLLPEHNRQVLSLLFEWYSDFFII